MHKSLAIAALVLFSVLGVASAGELSIRRIPLPGHGDFVIAVPDAWNIKTGQPGSGMPPTLILSAKSGAPFEILITPIWSMAGKPAPLDSASIRREVEGAANAAKPQAVEKVLAIETINAASGTGYYFTATDRAPNPGEYKYLTQGILPVGQLTVTFTILTNDGSDATVSAALLLLRDASQGKISAT